MDISCVLITSGSYSKALLVEQICITHASSKINTKHKHPHTNDGDSGQMFMRAVLDSQPPVKGSRTVG